MKQCVIDCSRIANPEDFHDALVEALVLPQWYGSNLDALYDCLTELPEAVHLILKNWDDAADFAPDFESVFEDAQSETTDFTIQYA